VTYRDGTAINKITASFDSNAILPSWGNTDTNRQAATFYTDGTTVPAKPGVIAFALAGDWCEALHHQSRCSNQQLIFV